ncbi:sensor histidine kinase [Faecalimonas sp.]
MEVIIFIMFFLLAIITIFLFWKYVHLKLDIYEYTQNLDTVLTRMLKSEELKPEPYKKDDLWSSVYDRLVRLSRLYLHKNMEISEEKDKLKELVSDISHQTKTSIANIKLYLEIMTDESNFKKNQEYMRKMNGQINKLDFLLQSMVKMSRLEIGTIKIQKQNTLLADTLAMAISNVIIKAENKDIKIKVEYDEKLKLIHDKKWTTEAIFNILDNAVKYTNNGGHIRVVVCRQELFTKISIEDNGKGIVPERLGTIFTRFYREPEIHDNEGIGIGLYLARKIITLQNGYIEVQSKVGKGSIFMIYLPNRDSGKITIL